MLASITPLGQRGRGASWRLTAGAFLAAAVLAGAGAGAVGGAAGALLLSGVDISPQARLALLAIAALGALAFDLGPLRLPGPRRQVDERWRDRYRGWVYGIGYGTQLGVGVATIVSSAATYLALLSALLTGSPVRGAVVFGVYGALRGATPLLAAGVHGPEQLLALHRGLARRRRLAFATGQLTLGAIVVLALIGSAL